MTRNRNKDWTDELRDIIDGVEMSPSDGGWERLNADLHPRRAVWYYAVPVAACLLFGAVFLFREQPSEDVLDVATDVPSAMVSEASSTDSVTPSAQQNSLADSSQTDQTSTDVESFSSIGIDDSAFPDISQIMEIQETHETHETRPDVPEEQIQPLLTVPAPSFDFGDEPVARQRKQRRKISVTVSAGGAVGFNAGNRYLAQTMTAPLTKSPVTKAPADDGYSGRVMDVSELIVHERPVITNLGVSVPLSDKFELISGLEFMQLSSSVLYGRQEQNWLGIPLKLGYSLWSWGPSAVGIGAGFKGEKCLSATLLGMDYNENFQWAASMGLDCRVKVFGPVSFGLYPELFYYLTGTNLPVYRSNHPLSFTVCAGLSVSL